MIRANGLKKDTSMRAKHRRHVSNSILWFIVLTFPIWLYWFGALAEQAPLEIYLILIPFSYYAILVLAPFIGVPWVLVVICLAIWEFRKRRALRQSIRAEKKRTVPVARANSHCHARSNVATLSSSILPLELTDRTRGTMHTQIFQSTSSSHR
jgi:hypothetical protein